MIYVSLFRFFVIVFMHINFMCELTLISRNGMNKVLCIVYTSSWIPGCVDRVGRDGLADMGFPSDWQ